MDLIFPDAAHLQRPSVMRPLIPAENGGYLLVRSGFVASGQWWEAR
ncbi:hypothetical protein [Streptomyces sp. NPDC018693]